MLNLLLVIARLAVVVALCVWVPGWIVTRRSPGALRVMFPAMVGLALHMAALVSTGLVVRSVTVALWVVPTLTYGLAFASRAVLTRGGREVFGGWQPPPLTRRGAVLVALLVSMAAVLRMLHNFHYDDLQHLLYLTEVAREDVLFPSQFMLRVTRVTLPWLGAGAVMLSRYPYWAASYTVLGQLAGAPAGDAYLLLGLGALALSLGLMTSLAAQAWGARTGRFWVVALLATSWFASDNLLNYGGYPFQTGKLFVLLAATAVVVAWRSGQPGPLAAAGVALFVAPLFHTNNVIGAGWVGVLLLVAMVASPVLRRAGLWTCLAFVLLGVAGGASFVSNGFIRWIPIDQLAQFETPPVVQAWPPPETVPAAAALVPDAAPAAPSVAPAVAPPDENVPYEPSVTKANSIKGRVQLFLSRGLPSEVTVLLLAILLAPFFASWQQLGARLGSSAFVLAVTALLAVCAVDAARQFVTFSIKPGYWRMRGALRSLAASAPADAAVVTDPVTDVFARAAGWPIRQPIADEPEQLRPVLLLFLPDVKGRALDAVLAGFGPSLIVANQYIVGAESVRKFEAHGLTTRFSTGALADDALVALDVEAARVVSAVRRREPGAIGQGLALVRLTLAEMFSGHRLEVFESTAERRTLDYPSLGPLLRNGPVQAPQVSAYLNGALVTLPGTDACVDSLNMRVWSEATFDMPLVTLMLDDARLPEKGLVPTVGLKPKADATSSAVHVGLGRRLCGTGPVSLLINSGLWWDGHFRVEDVAWHTAESVVQ